MAKISHCEAANYDIAPTRYWRPEAVSVPTCPSLDKLQPRKTMSPVPLLSCRMMGQKVTAVGVLKRSVMLWGDRTQEAPPLPKGIPFRNGSMQATLVAGATDPCQCSIPAVRIPLLPLSRPFDWVFGALRRPGQVQANTRLTGRVCFRDDRTRTRQSTQVWLTFVQTLLSPPIPFRFERVVTTTVVSSSSERGGAARRAPGNGT